MAKSKIREKSELINWPTQTTLTARSSTITSAFVHTITPWLTELTVDEETQVREIYAAIERKHGISILGATKKDHHCAYCGASATSADHIRPLVENCESSGNITEIYNLIPCCASCNSSKGNKVFEDWYDEAGTIDRVRKNANDYLIRKPALIELITELEKYSSKSAVDAYRRDPIVAKRLKRIYEMRDDINKRMKDYEAECLTLGYDTEIALKGFGAFAQDQLRKKLTNAKNKKDIVANFLDKAYCKTEFNQDFTVLSVTRKDVKGYDRYYSTPLKIGGATYYLCSQWKKSLHRKQLINWLIHN